MSNYYGGIMDIPVDDDLMNYIAKTVDESLLTGQVTEMHDMKQQN